MIIYLLTEYDPSPQKLAYWGLPDVKVVREVPQSGTVLVNLPYCRRTLPLFRQLSWRKGIRWGLLRMQCLPRPTRSTGAFLRDILPPAILGLHYADFALCAGTEGAKHPLIGPQTTLLQTCAPDVLHVDDNLSSNFWRPQPYIVFLDEGIREPHTDYAILRLKPPSYRQYRTELRETFRNVLAYCPEIWYICEAPHPCQAKYKAETPSMVAFADVVLAHSSTAVSFAVLRRKPIKILHLPCLQGRPEGRNAHAMEDALNLGYADYTTKYLGIPEAMAAKRTPMEALADYA